jgi:hypothetical protein
MDIHLFKLFWFPSLKFIQNECNHVEVVKDAAVLQEVFEKRTGPYSPPPNILFLLREVYIFKSNFHISTWND